MRAPPMQRVSSMNTTKNSATRRCPFLPLLAVPLLAISNGCTHSSGTRPELAPSGNRLELSRACEKLAKNVDDPVVNQRTDPWRAIGEYAVALGTANDNIDATRDCQQRQRERLGGENRS